MNLVSFIHGEHDWADLIEGGIKEVILSPSLLSRLGSSSMEQIKKLSTQCLSRPFRCVLLWDTLPDESQLKEHISFFNRLPLKNFHAIRVLDSGVFHFLKKNHPSQKIQLILENVHNLPSLMGWCELGGDQLERIILSPQLDKKTLTHFVNNLPLPVELMGLGRLLLYHSPRKLLSGDFASENSIIQLKADNMEGHHKGFDVLQNPQGTFMFHPKDYNLLEYLDEIDQIGVDWLRLDATHTKPGFLPALGKLMNCFDRKKACELKKQYTSPSIHGFYGANRSDSLFKKLKKFRPSPSSLGEIIAVKKNSYLGIMLKNKKSINIGDRLLFKTPDGKEKTAIVSQLRNLLWKQVSSISGKAAFIGYTRGISIKTAVFHQ